MKKLRKGGRETRVVIVQIALVFSRKIVYSINLFYFKEKEGTKSVPPFIFLAKIRVKSAYQTPLLGLTGFPR